MLEHNFAIEPKFWAIHGICLHNIYKSTLLLKVRSSLSIYLWLLKKIFLFLSCEDRLVIFQLILITSFSGKQADENTGCSRIFGSFFHVARIMARAWRNKNCSDGITARCKRYLRCQQHPEVMI